MFFQAFTVVVASQFLLWAISALAEEQWHDGPDLEHSQIKFAGEFCPLCELSPSAPENQRKRAQKLQAEADEVRRFWKGVDCELRNVKGPDLTVLFSAAANAVACPDRVDARLVVASWKDWWRVKIPYDTRNPADRFLDYVKQRQAGIIKDTPLILGVESRLAKEYGKTVVTAQDACAENIHYEGVPPR